MRSFIYVVVLALLAAPAAHAVLGQKTVFPANAKAMAKVSSSNLWTMHEIKNEANTVHEFADANGTVFAVSWRGISRPDLSQLLGDYAAEFQQAEKKETKSMIRHPSQIKTSRMIVKRGGHMRDIRGFAYDPSLVPAGVSIEDLQRE